MGYVIKRICYEKAKRNMHIDHSQNICENSYCPTHRTTVTTQYQQTR